MPLMETIKLPKGLKNAIKITQNVIKITQNAFKVAQNAFKKTQNDLLQASFDKERPSTEKGRNSLVHDAVALHEAQAGLRQGNRVQRASARPRVRFLDLGHQEPVGIGRLLLLEGPFEGVHEVPDPECADGVASDGVPRRGEDRIH